MSRAIDPSAAKGRLHAGAELAFLDIRETGEFGEGHPLFAVPCPYSRLEPLVARLVPRKDVPVLVIDGGDGVAERAARRLEAFGYRDVAFVNGGTPAWERAGFTLFKGVNVPSKTLGELAEHLWHPETVDAPTMKAWSSSGKASLFDGRPPAEFLKMHVPGAICLPNGELAHRLDALPETKGRPIVVGCAGRTRGIIGAIGLRLSGYEGPVYALENGTQGWALAGFTLERGVPAEPLPALEKGAREAARARAEAFLDRWNLPLATADDVRAFLSDATRTTFAFDVRSEAESDADPLPVAPHAPSGQMVQSTDQYVGVRHARIVLCDDSGMRGALAAFWLRQLGFEPYVALIDDGLRAVPASSEPLASPTPALATIAAEEALATLRSSDARLIDLRSSRAYRQVHVSNAVWSIRPRLAAVATGHERVVLVADDAELLAGAAQELADIGLSDVSVVSGGHDALVAVGAEVVTSPDTPSEADAVDFLSFVHDRHDGNLEASRRYLAWETGLIAQLDAAERAEFRMTPEPPVQEVGHRPISAEHGQVRSSRSPS